MLTRHEPSQILFPPAAQDTVLEKIVDAEFPSAGLVLVPRRAWNEIKSGCVHSLHT